MRKPRFKETENVRVLKELKVAASEEVCRENGIFRCDLLQLES